MFTYVFSLFLLRYVTSQRGKYPGIMNVLELSDDRNANRSNGTRSGLEREGHMGELALPQITGLIRITGWDKSN